MIKNHINVVLVASMLLVALFGCGKHEEPVAPAKKKAEPAKPAVPKPAPVQKQLSSVTKAGGNLDFKRRTDPFKPFVTAAPVEITAPQAKAAQSRGRSMASDTLPIQSFEATRFKVVGIIAGLKENMALLIDPNGKGYTVHAGMQVGSNDGVITKITSSSVEVVEKFREDNGRFKRRKVVLTLATKR